MSKLHEIAKQRRLDVKEAKEACPLSSLREKMKDTVARFGEPLSLQSRFSSQPTLIPNARMHVAAEFKRASPSKGAIAGEELKLEEQVSMYCKAGASLISILTEPTWFKGTLHDMEIAKETIISLSKPDTRPLILRKDFIIDIYQLYEAVAFGADTVLLIVALLTDQELTELIRECRLLGMEPLVEAANPEETLRAIKCGSKVLGINNRDLTTFKLDLTTTIRCAQVVPASSDVILIALSGMKGRNDVLLYEPLEKVRGILVGEHLMTCADPIRSIHELVISGNEENEGKPLVKICGLVRAEDALVACHAKADFIGLIFVAKSPRCVSVSEAQVIAKAVRDFRETSGPVTWKRAKLTKEEWFVESAKELKSAARRGPLLVGVFQDHLMSEVNRIVFEVGLDLVQFHGKEPWESITECAVPVIKVVHVGSHSCAATDAHLLSSVVPGTAVAVLLDTTVDGVTSGGSGVGFDWVLAARYQKLGIPVIVAGGLTPDNVKQAVTEAGVPFGVDCSSGVQISPREKSKTLIESFVRNAKA